MTAADDAADAALAAQGDSRAFERLYWRHGTRVKALARRLLGSADAEDGVQEVFIRAWDRLDQFRGDAAFGSWLHRLAVNVLLRQLQRHRRHGDHIGLADQPAPEPATIDEDLTRALASLPAPVREVVVLHDMESYTHQEIAEMLGIGVSASKMRLHRGREALRRFITVGGS